MDNRVVRFLGMAMLLVGALVGCASAPSSPESTLPPTPLEIRLSEARAMVSEARAAGYAIDTAELFLRDAEQAQAAGDEKRATALAEQVKQAIAARKAIEEARPVVAAAVQDAGILASDAAKLLDAADAALKAGDPLRASELAAQARRQAGDAVVQKKSETTRLAREQADRYRVQRGDSLWSIAGRTQVYGNPLHWPLLLQANRVAIKDSDLIHPGQSLIIGRGFSAAEEAAAARHARTRGSWQVGPTEEADRAFLRR
jgi:nucleoid-associated protein YgaU